MENPQVKLIKSISYKKDTVEFIKHQDYHLYLYFNGQKLDVIHPRSCDLYQDTSVVEIYKDLIFGKSRFNKSKVQGFFQKVIPEHFL